MSEKKRYIPGYQGPIQNDRIENVFLEANLWKNLHVSSGMNSPPAQHSCNRRLCQLILLSCLTKSRFQNVLRGASSVKGSGVGQWHVKGRHLYMGREDAVTLLTNLVHVESAEQTVEPLGSKGIEGRGETLAKADHTLPGRSQPPLP